jgi:(2R)-ethylmalonyl-CoA mutase
VLSGSHLELVEDIFKELRQVGLAEIPVIVGGIIPVEDERVLRSQGVAAVYTPKHSDLNTIMLDLVAIIRQANDLPPCEQQAA